MPADRPRGIIWIASYPKSGNTWMRMLLAHYAGGSDVPRSLNAPGLAKGIASSRAQFDALLGIGSSDLTEDEAQALRPAMARLMVQADAAPLWIKVHDAQRRLPDGQWLLPPDVSVCAIYLVRDPRDVAVSRAFHDGHADIARSVAALCNPHQSVSGGPMSQVRQVMGDWSQHVRSWIDDPVMPVLLLRYEDMLADTAQALHRVLAFACPDQPIDAARLETAVAATAFDALQKAEDAEGFRECTPYQKRFFRKGVAGDWRNHLTPEQAQTICNQHRTVMDRLGYDTR